MEVTSICPLRSMVRPSLSQPKPAWANPAVFSGGVCSLKMKRNRSVVVVRKDFSTEEKQVSGSWRNGLFLRMAPDYGQDVMPTTPQNDNPQFIIFVKRAHKCWYKKTEWFPLAMVEGSSTAKQIILAKNPKDTIARELASVIYKDEKEIEKQAKLMLNNATEFRYGFKLVDNGNMKAPVEIINNITELPKKEKMTNVLSRDMSKAKEPFGKLTLLESI